MKKKHYHCPVNGWDCLYYSDDPYPCACTLENPYKNCDDFASLCEEDDYCCGECLERNE